MHIKLVAVRQPHCGCMCICMHRENLLMELAKSEGKVDLPCTVSSASAVSWPASLVALQTYTPG